MSLIQFNNTNEYYNVEILNHSKGEDYKRITLFFEEGIDITTLFFDRGFHNINEYNKSLQGDYSEFKYIYYLYEEENKVILTNNPNDIYVEIIPDKIPTDDSHVPTLEELKLGKVNYFSSICYQSIINGVDIEIDGGIEHFSYTNEDQVNIKEIFDLAVQTNVPSFYHADGKSCKLYTVDQIIALYSTATTNKMHHITYFNQLKMYINDIKDKVELSELVYGTELTGEYLDIYNSAMQQAQLVLETVLSQRENVTISLN